MSPVEIMALPGAVPSSPSGETADASAFQGALAQHAEASAPPRGRLSTGRAIHQQTHASAHAAPLSAKTGLISSAVAELVAPLDAAEAPPLATATDAASLIADKTPSTECAVAPTAETMVEAALTTPAAMVACDVAPVPTAAGEVAADAPIVNGKAADPLAPNVAPDIQTPLALPAEGALAEGAVLAGQQTVGTGPEITPLTVPTPPVKGPEVAVAPPAPEAPAAPVDSDAPTPLPSGDAPAIENGQAADAGNVEAAKADPVSNDEAVASPGDTPEAPPVASQSGQSALSSSIRADAPIAQRLSFDTVTQLSAQILRKLEGRSTRFEMELHPADMGRVDVRLEIDDQGRLAARLAFDNPAAGIDMRGRIDDLRRQLEDAGFQLADDAFSFDDREGGRGQSHDDQGGRRSLIASAVRNADAIDMAAQLQPRAAMRAGIDVRI